MGISKSQPTFIFFIWASLTCLVSSLPSDQFAVVSTPVEFLTEERLSELFQQWKEKHGKVYEHAQEAEKRFENFRNSLKYIMEKNSKRKSSTEHVVGLNKFADMSNEEFRRVYTSKVKRPVDKNRTSIGERKPAGMGSCEAPSSLDWRKYGVVTPVKDQGQCGSCWAFSVTGAIEGVNALATGDLISLSEQELVNCDKSNYGCEGGDMDYAFEWVITNGGIDTEANYPYTGLDGPCNVIKEQNKVVTIDSYIDVEEEESALLSAVAKQPVTVGIDGSAYDFQLYTKGIYDGECSPNPNNIDHAILIVGYGSEGDEDYWIAKNSWGTYWGMEGYIYIKRNTKLPYGVCAINAEASYPTKQSSSPSPYPSPIVPPPPPLPPSPPPPPPSPPTPPPPSQCGDFSYCPTDETCCCLFDFFDFCLVYGCCPYTNGVCCEGTSYCCPSNYPICDTFEGLCFKAYGDSVGVAAKKRKMAKHKLPWEKIEDAEKEQQPLQWKRNKFAAMM